MHQQVHQITKQLALQQMSQHHRYPMGYCVKAANDYNELNPNKEFMFCVLRMLDGASALTGSMGIPAVRFREPDQNGNMLNSHCFLNYDGRVWDPMFGLFDYGIDTYLTKICNHVELGPKQHLVLFDIQELGEEHRKNNRSQFIESSPLILLASFLVNTTNNTVTHYVG